jgi:hypothetical protein
MADKLLTWQEKLKAGQPLNELEQVKADADFNYRQRLREQQEREAHKKMLNGELPAASAEQQEAEPVQVEEEKKGKK